MKSHPEWLNKATFYEIYPQSFYDTNGDGIGDIKGIIEKLPYIKSLGFNAIWLNPFYQSSFYDAGYDIIDFRKVARRYGTNQDAYNLFKKAHAKGIKVMLDFVPGHTSIDSPWFKKSCEATKNEYSDRYIWTENVWQTPKDLPVIRGFTERDGSVVTNFFSIQPALNYGFAEVENPWEEDYNGVGPKKTIAEMISILKFWLSHGADGFRCDMAACLVKRDPDQEGTIAVWKKIIGEVKKEYPEAAFVSEWNNPKNSLRAGFDMDFLLQDSYTPVNCLLTRSNKPYFRFDEEKKNGKLFFDNYMDLYDFAESQNKFLSLITGNHDTVRLAKYLTPEEMKFYFAFLFTMPNVPFVYYGDEIGMKYEEGLTSVEGGYYRTGSRSPMQWNREKNAGFTTSNKPYIKINPDRKGISVEEEETDSDSLYSFVKKLLAFRKEHVALDNDAGFEMVKTANTCPLVYIRKKFSEKLLIAINPSNKTYNISLGDFKGENLLSLGTEKIQNGKLKLSPRSLVILD